MRRLADRELPAMDSLIRSIKRWESGEVEPGPEYQELLADAFRHGLTVDTELLDRLAQSDLTSTQLGELQAAIDGLAVSYTTNTPAELLDETFTWLNRLDQARTGRLGLDQLRTVLELTGWAALLAGNLAYDLNDQNTATRAREIGLTHGREIDHDRMIAWGHELAAWSHLGNKNYTAVIERSRAGQDRAGRTDIGAHLTRHEAEAWAGLGDEAQARRTLERAAAINDDIPPPPMPGHHFQKDKDQQEKVEMSVAMALGDNSHAIELADAIERQFTAEDGELLRPMRIAKARATKATAIAREGDLDEATAIGESVFEIERQGIPEIMRQTEELADLLANFKSAGSFLEARTQRQSAA
jgi:hypothetical protein